MEQADRKQSQDPQAQSCTVEERWSSGRRIIPALSTPLAFIFGSGFLVIVPVLASGVGPYVVWAMLAVAVVAFHTGAIVRHNILCAEPVLAAGSQRVTLVLERRSDGALAAAVSVLLAMPLILAAGLSQFSAAVADTLAATANLEEVTRLRVTQRWGYLLVGSAAIALAWTGSTFTVIALASRAFALYYLLQCLVALSVCRNHRERARFFLVALALSFVLLFAVPAG